MYEVLKRKAQMILGETINYALQCKCEVKIKQI